MGVKMRCRLIKYYKFYLEVITAKSIFAVIKV